MCVINTGNVYPSVPPKENCCVPSQASEIQVGLELVVVGQPSHGSGTLIAKEFCYAQMAVVLRTIRSNLERESAIG